MSDSLIPELKPNWLNGKIVASLSMVEYTRQRYPKRDVIADVHIDDGDFYYFSQTGRVRWVRNKTEIWTGAPAKRRR